MGETFTDESGFYEVLSLEGRSTQMRVTKAGYKTKERVFAPLTQCVTDADFELAPDSLLLNS